MGGEEPDPVVGHDPPGALRLELVSRGPDVRHVLALGAFLLGVASIGGLQEGEVGPALAAGALAVCLGGASALRLDRHVLELRDGVLTETRAGMRKTVRTVQGVRGATLRGSALVVDADSGALEIRGAHEALRDALVSLLPAQDAATDPGELAVERLAGRFRKSGDFAEITTGGTARWVTLSMVAGLMVLLLPVLVLVAVFPIALVPVVLATVALGALILRGSTDVLELHPRGLVISVRRSVRGRRAWWVPWDAMG
ncbi:MAG: hypothetical protein KC656_23550, partial [Myxococcales bacterium]|nr:hypothetical protein [Myxococcales bacterium]